jgi:hypothetical protein
MLTSEELKRHLHYNPDTGHFTRLIKLRGPKAASGYVHTSGYVRICVLGRKYAAHRLAWLYMHGEWPDRLIDHVNGVKSDNRITNLRQSDFTLNAENQKRASVTSLSGLLGVCVARDRKRSKPYQARICVRGVSHYLGCFSTPEEAHEAYKQMKRTLHAGCTI